MKNLINVIIGLAVISFILAIISRLTVQPIFGVQPPAMAASAEILLLLAIALSVKK